MFNGKRGSSSLIMSIAELPGPPAKKTIGSGWRPGPVAGITTTRMGISGPVRVILS